MKKQRGIAGSVALAACLAVVIVAMCGVGLAQASSLSTIDAKRAIATKSFDVNAGLGTITAYGAKHCKRHSKKKVSCQGYVKQRRHHHKVVCSDRMTAVKHGHHVRVKGVAPASRWHCHR